MVFKFGPPSPMPMVAPQGPEDVLSLSSVQRLLRAGLAEDWRDGYGLSFLHLVAMSENASAIEVLISRGWNPRVEVASSDVSVFEGMSPIHFAAYCGRAECLDALLQDKALANHPTKLGLRPLHLASIGQYDAAEILLVMGADPNARDDTSETPFIHACGAANIGRFAPSKILDLLLARGADPTVVSSNQLSALHLAADAGEDRWVDRFLQLGIDVNCVTSTGETPLHRAARFNHHSTCRLLIQRGAKVDSMSMSGKTPMSLAVERSAIDAVNVLLEHGAKVSAQTRSAMPHGSSHFSVDLDHNYIGLEARREDAAQQVVRALIRAGADINARDEQGITPLHVCFLPNYLGHLSKELATCYSDLV